MEPRIMMETPWGATDLIDTVAPGIVWVATPSHGGVYLSPENNARVPAAWREASFNGLGRTGWYEEDCDWCLAALTFPDAFPTHQEAAKQTFTAFFASKLGEG